MRTLRKQRGYLLISVIVTLFLVASIAVLLAHDSSISANTSSTELESARAGYVAEAAMQHALWRTSNNACMGEVTIPPTALGIDSYDATITGAAAGTAFTLPADQDAWIRSDDVKRNNGTATWNHVRTNSGNIEQVLTRFDLSSLPVSSQIVSATAWFHIRALKPHPEGAITVHEVTADWAEASITWELFAGSLQAGHVATISPQDSGDVWVSINITGQVQAWVNGRPNYGILFNPTGEGTHSEYTAREDGSNPPRLEVVVGGGPASPVTIQATGTLANGVTRIVSRPLTAAYQPPVIHTFRPGPAESNDAEIWDQAPNNNYGDAAETWVSSASNDTTRTLLRFNMGVIPTGAKILEATLFLYRQSGSGADQPVSAHRIMNPWSEDSVTWNSGLPGTNWDTAGGDFQNSAVATTPIGPAKQLYEWNIAPLVQGWVDGSYPNYGIAMTAAMPGMAGERFYTSDQAILDKRPSLGVTFACECGSTCMAPQALGNVLMPVTSTSNPAPGELLRIALLESWGYVVNTTWQKNSQANFNSSISANDVVYVPVTVDPAEIGTKLTNATIGVVNELGSLNDELGIASGSDSPVGSTLNISDNSHYITMPFAAGPLYVYSAAMNGLAVAGTPAPGLQTLGDWNGAGGPAVLDAGAVTSGGGAAAGRRVLLPIGGAGIDFAHVNNNGRLIMQRSLAWAMGADIGVREPMFLSTDSAATLGGLTFDDIDLAKYDPGNDSAILYFEGRLTTLDSDIDALHVLTNDHIVMSTKADGIFGGLKFTDGSLIDYDPANDVATLFFDESAFSDDENIVSVYVMDNGHIVLSTDSDATLGGLSFTDNDLVEYDPGSDSATLFFDGSTTTLTSDIDAVHLLGNGHIVLSTKDNANLGGLGFDDGDLVDYDPLADTAVLYFDEGLFNGNEDLISIHIGPGSGKAIPPKKVYWTDDNAGLIQRSNEDGSNIEILVSGQTNVRGLDLDTVNGKLYWTSDTDIRRANLDGSNIETIFSGTLVNLDIKLDVPAGKMYWSHDNGNDQVMRSDLDGSGSETINNSLEGPAYLTLDTAAGYLYLTEFAVGDVSRMNLDGSSSTTLITGPAGAVGNALDTVGGKVFWSSGASGNWIKRANLDGSDEETIVTGLNAPQDIVYDADNDRIYWTDALVNPAIKRANADGSNVETIVTGLIRPRGILVVDAAQVPPTGGGGGGADTYRDEFNATNYSGSDGTLAWSTEWLEVGENDGATSGDEQVRSDSGFDFVLRVRDNNNGGEGVQREADLSGCSSAKFSFDYRRKSFDNSSDYVTIDVSSNGGSSWSELDRLSGPANESAYQSISYSLAAHTATNTRIRFLTSPDLGGTDEFLVDNVEISCAL